MELDELMKKITSICFEGMTTDRLEKSLLRVAQMSGKEKRAEGRGLVDSAIYGRVQHYRPLWCAQIHFHLLKTIIFCFLIISLLRDLGI